MSKVLKRALNVIGVLGGGWAAWDGMREFDHATSALPFIRGLFWLLVGTGAFLLSLHNIIDDLRGRDE